MVSNPQRMKVTECTARTLQQKQAIEELDGSIEDVDLVMANAEKALNSIGVTIPLLVLPFVVVVEI